MSSSLFNPDGGKSGLNIQFNKLEFYTSHGHGCGFYSELIFVDSKTLKWAHSRLRNYFSNAACRQKATDRKLHP
jgi:hypothetical protein